MYCFIIQHMLRNCTYLYPDQTRESDGMSFKNWTNNYWFVAPHMMIFCCILKHCIYFTPICMLTSQYTNWGICNKQKRNTDIFMKRIQNFKFSCQISTQKAERIFFKTIWNKSTLATTSDYAYLNICVFCLLRTPVRSFMWRKYVWMSLLLTSVL